jgi:hypothetical protein
VGRALHFWNFVIATCVSTPTVKPFAVLDDILQPIHKATVRCEASAAFEFPRSTFIVKCDADGPLIVAERQRKLVAFSVPMGPRAAGFLVGGMASVAGLTVMGYFHVLRHHDATAARLRRAEADSRTAPPGIAAINAQLTRLEGVSPSPS